MKTIEFFFDIYSPYAYLASCRLLEIAGQNDCKIDYRPIDLPRIKKSAGNTGPANIEIPPKIKYLMSDLAHWASLYGLPLAMIGSNDSALINKGMFYAAKKNMADQYVSEAYRLTWGEGGDPSDQELLKLLAKAMGFDETEFLSFLNSAEAESLYESSNTEAINRGVFGVPTMFCDEHMWWGNDRLMFLEDYLNKS